MTSEIPTKATLSKEKRQFAQEHLDGKHARRYVDACDMCWGERNRLNFGVIPTPWEDD